MKISKYFTWKEATYLTSWKREATQEDGLTDDIKANLEDLFNKMDLVREYFNKPIIVHIAYRSDKYNKEVKGAPKSAHVLGKACDFHIKDTNCDEARAQIVKDGKLEEWGMRMEDLPGSNWIHLDTNPVKNKRFFKP